MDIYFGRDIIKPTKLFISFCLLRNNVNGRPRLKITNIPSMAKKEN